MIYKRCDNCSGSSVLLVEDSAEAEGLVDVTSTNEELVLEFDPVKTKGVEEALQHIHHHEHRELHSHEGEPNNEGTSSLSANRVLGKSVPWHLKDLLQEDESKLRVGKGKSPQT